MQINRKHAVGSIAILLWHSFLSIVTSRIPAVQDLVAMFNVTHSCMGSSESGSSSFCHSVSWQKARMFIYVPQEELPPYYTSSPLTDDEQDEFAKTLYSTIIGNRSISKQCSSVLKDFTCFTVFPECPVTGNAMYFPPCKSLCDSVVSQCRHEMKLDLKCGEYSVTACMTRRPSLPSDSQYLPESQGPYTLLPCVYAMMTIINAFILLCTIWLYLWSCGLNQREAHLRVLLVFIMAIRVFVMSICYLFWTVTVENNNVYNTFDTDRISMLHHMCETLGLFVLMSLSRGHNYTHVLKWKERQAQAMIVMTIYVIFAAFGSTKATLDHFNTWLTMIIPIYSVIFLLLTRYCAREVAIINAQIEKLHRGTENENLVKALLDKRLMFSQLYAVIWVYVITETICLILFALRVQWVALMSIVESSSTIIWACIVYIFACRHERSIFFYMIPSSHVGSDVNADREEDINHQQATPDSAIIVQVKNGTDFNKDDEIISTSNNIGARYHELELAPLLGPPLQAAELQQQQQQQSNRDPLLSNFVHGRPLRTATRGIIQYQWLHALQLPEFMRINNVRESAANVNNLIIVREQSVHSANNPIDPKFALGRLESSDISDI